MEERKCRNCGAHLTSVGGGRWRCEYCGSVYEAQSFLGEIQFVEINRAQAQKIVAKVAIPREYREGTHADTLSRYTLGQLRQQLAEGLEAFMKISTEEDPFLQTTIVRGEVRVIPPDHRF